MIGTILQNRYHLDAELGRGGMGVIYRAHDTLLDRAVAVKVLSESKLGAHGRTRLLNEAQAAARLNHPNIVSVYDVGEAGGSPFIVMELVEGETLFERKPQLIDDILAVARQVCAALDHAHTHGIVHRDLKLENILISARSAQSPGEKLSVKLTDFGLARSLASRLTGGGAMMGTVFYMAPELALGQPSDGRADLYALGVMLYELATGRLPFEGDDPIAIISQHLYAPVVPPSTHAPALPPALDALITRLLAKQPDDRPTSAAEVLRVLESISAGATVPQSALPQQEGLSLLDRIARGRLIGRDKELAEAIAHWKRAMAGEGHVLLISGEPGIGKTRLARELAAQVQVSGATLLAGECYVEGGPPYAPTAQALRESMNDPRNPIEQLGLPEPILVDLLRMALDPRARAPDGHVAPSDAQAEQLRLFESVVSWCAALAARAPVMLLVDDVHWADAGTLALLRHLARRARKLPVLIVLTYREIELDETRPLSEVLHALNRERLAGRIKLARLSEAQTRDLLQAMLAEDVTPQLAESIYRETEGNPFFIEEVVKVLIEEQKLYRDGSRWCCTALDEVEIPQSVRVTIQARVGRLPEPAQDVLRLAAFLGREFDFDTLKQASGADEESLISALETAQHAQLISEVRAMAKGRVAASSRFAFAHALIPSTLRESVSGLRRQRLHRRAAAAIEALRPDDFETLAYQFASAGDEERAWTYYRRAGDRARSLYANEDALRFYTEALALMPDDHPDRFEILAGRVAVYDLIGRRDAQRADVDALVALAERLDDVRRFDAHLALTDFYLATDLIRAHEPAQRAVELARALGDLLREARALRRMGWQHYYRAESIPAQAAMEAAAARFREAGQVNETAACLNMLALVHLFGLGDRGAAQQAAEEAVALSRQAGDRRQEAVSLRRLAMVYGAQKRRAEELAFTEQALAVNRELGNRSEERNALYNLGIIYARLGRYAESENALRRSMELAEEIRSPQGLNNSLEALIRLHMMRRGEYEAALAFIEGYTEQARAAQDETLDFALAGIAVTVLVKLGQYARGLAIAERFLPVVGRLYGSTVEASVYGGAGLLQACLGRFEEARQSIARAREIVEHAGTPSDIAWKWAHLAWVDLLEGDARNDPEIWRQGVAHSQKALAVLRQHESDQDWIEEVHVAARLHLQLDELNAALECSNEVLRLAADLPANIHPERYDFTHSQILRRLGRDAEAGDFLRRAYERVTLVAHNLHDPDLRRGWLEQAWLNPQILEAARAHLVV